MKIFKWIKWCVGLLLIVAIGTFVWLAFKGYEMYDQRGEPGGDSGKGSQQAELYPIERVA